MSEAVEGEVVNQPTPFNLTKHPEETVSKLEAAFNNAFNITEACHYAGISRETYYQWLADDDIFSTRMSAAQAAPNMKAKEIVLKAINDGDPQLALRYLTLRDPDFKPKAVMETPEGQRTTEEKLKEFMDDTNDGAYSDSADAGGAEPATSVEPAGSDEVAQSTPDIPE